MENNTQPQQITINDLTAIRSILDLAAQRGAFKGPELEEVGSIYNRLSRFLEFAVSQLQANSEDSEQAEGSAQSTAQAEGQGE